MNKPQHILILGSYGRGNVGDDAFLLAALELFPNQILYINSADDELLPAEVKARVTTISTHSLRDIVNKLFVFKRIQAIVYCGGDVWVELHGNRFSRKSLYKMVILNSILRLAGKQAYYIGCGTGKLTGYSLWLARLAARLANGIMVREQRSAEVLGLSKVQVAPDLTVNLPYFQQKKVRQRDEGQRCLIGISILYYVPNPKRNFTRLLDSLTKLVESLPKEKFRIILLPMLVSSRTPHDDLWASKQLLSRINTHDVQIIVPHNVKECVNTLSSLDILVGVRLHANILATLSGTPCLGVAYRPKVSSFFHDNEIDEYCCANFEELSELETNFWNMYHNYPKVRQHFSHISKQLINKRSAYHAFVDRHINFHDPENNANFKKDTKVTGSYPVE